MVILKRQLLIGAYVTALFAPLVLMVAGHNPADAGVVTITAVGIGAIAFAGVVLQFVLASRVAVIARPFGMDLLIRFHRVMGLGIAALVVAHVALVVVARLDRLETLVEETGNVVGILALLLLLAIVLSSWPRHRPQRSYEFWRGLHAGLGVAVVAATFFHVLRSGHYATNEVIAWIMAMTVAIAALALFAVRVARPFAVAGRPYRLVDKRMERGSAVTLVLEAEAQRAASTWHAGQFAWLKLAGSTFSLAEHPFSLTSSALDPAQLSFTCKTVGDFTTLLRDLPIGSKVLVDGPHGSYRPAMDGTPRLLIVAGSGIAPAMSILRTMADAGERASVQLMYGVRSIHDATFVEEIEALRMRLICQIDYVVSADASWTGFRGRIDAALVRHLAPPDVCDRDAFVCGPREFVDEVTTTLHQLGVPRSRVHGEQF